MSPDKNSANWPPKSPYEALLSSPSGRKRWEEQRDRFHRRDTSPSPRAKSVTTSKALQALQDMTDHDDDNDEDDEDEDEETLRLQLQAIEAKLKLKKLQAKKKHDTTSTSTTDSTTTSPRKRQEQNRVDPAVPASPSRRSKTSALLPGVQIPVSPIKDRMPPPDLSKHNTSPARILLGIDKGLKAKDVSLKRARPGPPLQRPGENVPIHSTPKPSFSERIAATRLSNEEQDAKHRRIQQARSGGFALPSSSTTAAPSLQTRPLSARNPPSFSSDAPSTTDSPFISRTRSTPASSLAPSERFSIIHGDSEGKSTEPAEDGSSFETYSSTHLSRRNIPHTDLVRNLDGKEIYTLPRLLKEIKAPHYDPPDCEADFVVFAIIASKSSPYTSKAKHHTNSSVEPDRQEEINPSNKFMVLNLTDLKWELDLFLFGTAFTQFWKLTPGTLIAILNPGIMPPKGNQHNGRFSLKLASSEDSVLEIGNARDLGFCKSIKKDGKECEGWVNKRKSQFCDYHVELAVEKTRRSRMETNGMYRPNNPATGNKAFKFNSRVLPNGMPSQRPPAARTDFESASQYYMGGTGGFSAAKLFDAEDIGKADAMRRRLKEREKERILGEKLGRLGNGMGAEYLQASSASTVSSDKNKKYGAPSSSAAASSSFTLARPNEFDHDLDPEALGLLSKKAADVDLRPAKGRKRAFDSSASSIATTGGGVEAMGWGGANRRLGYNDRAPSPEKGQTKVKFPGGLAGPKDKPADESSPRKRARFALEGKGLREPGRESLGTAGGEVKRDAKGRIIVEAAPESSDDDLDIF